MVGIFPNRTAIFRLVGAVLAEQTDEWTEQRRYMGLELLAKAQQATIDSQPERRRANPTPRRSPHRITADLPGDRLYTITVDVVQADELATICAPIPPAPGTSSSSESLVTGGPSKNASKSFGRHRP